MAMEIVDDLANDADAEQEDEDVEEEEEEEEENGVASRARARARAVAAWGKEYGSESEAQAMVGGRRRGHQQQRRRENWVERAWEMRRSIMMRDRNENRNRRVVLLQKQKQKQKKKKKMKEEEDDEEDEEEVEDEDEDEEEDGGRRRPRMRMDLEEVKACRDLGLGLPPDWTVELPYGLSGGETSSGGNSRITSPGDDPREVKARLKAWAHAVVIASASHLQD